VKVRALSHFRHYTNLHRCEGRLRRVLGDFRFGTMRRVLEQRGLLLPVSRRPASEAFATASV
jgi:Domain of unknown function (DUF3473)